ncbi:MAG: nucleoside-triphosphatase [Promethearchaeota archaeon]
MKNKILITGAPRCGKSTFISQVIDYCIEKKGFNICGFLTPEIRKNGNRIGFNIVDVFSKNIFSLARVGNFKSRYKVGKYYVFIEEFEKYLNNYLDLQEKSFDLIVIDEIGKMELLSSIFQAFIKKIFLSNNSILATIGLKLHHPLKNYLLNLPSVQLLNLNRQNFRPTFQKVISIIT